MELVISWTTLWAFLIGAAGSVAYFTVVYFGFIGAAPDSRDTILRFFRGGRRNALSPRKIFWYALIGGIIAAIFQLPESVFVPIQSFVLGTTWPSVVGQLLSGRQTGQPLDTLAEANRAIAPTVERQTQESIETFDELLSQQPDEEDGERNQASEERDLP